MQTLSSLQAILHFALGPLKQLGITSSSSGLSESRILLTLS